MGRTLINNSLLLVAFSMGLLGGGHCAGMCGGIVSALTFGGIPNQANSIKLTAMQICYNLGRILSYSLMGALFGACSMGITHVIGVGQLFIMRDFAAVFMIILGLYVTGWWRGLLYVETVGQQLWQPISRYARRLFPIRSPSKALFMGLIWGFLPCGLVYSALALTLTVGSALQGALIMFAFGIGTLPALIAIGSSVLSSYYILQTPIFRTITGIALIVWGMVTLGANHLAPQQHCAAALGSGKLCGQKL